MANGFDEILREFLLINNLTQTQFAEKSTLSKVRSANGLKEKQSRDTIFSKECR